MSMRLGIKKQPNLHTGLALFFQSVLVFTLNTGSVLAQSTVLPDKAGNMSAPTTNKVVEVNAEQKVELPQAPKSQVQQQAAPILHIDSKGVLTPQTDKNTMNQNIASAVTVQEYKVEVAKHLYTVFEKKLHQGFLMHNLPAIGVLVLIIDTEGKLVGHTWRRKPSLDEYVALTEKMIYEASPYPAPVKLGKVEIMDIWLWTKAKEFQLDTFSPGQK